MKHLGILFTFLALIGSTWAETLAERAANLVAAADHVVIRSDLQGKKTPESNQVTVVSDAAWIAEVSATIKKAPINKGDHCLCIGWQTAYFYKKDELLIAIAAIHGNQLRIHTKKGGGDFEIDEPNWKAVSAALKISPQTKAVTFPDPKAMEAVWPPKVQLD